MTFVVNQLQKLSIQRQKRLFKPPTVQYLYDTYVQKCQSKYANRAKAFEYSPSRGNFEPPLSEFYRNTGFSRNNGNPFENLIIL